MLNLTEKEKRTELAKKYHNLKRKGGIEKQSTVIPEDITAGFFHATVEDGAPRKLDRINLNQRMTQFSSQKQLKARARNAHITNVTKGTALALCEQAQVEQQMRDLQGKKTLNQIIASRKTKPQLTQWQMIAKTFREKHQGLNQRQRNLRAVSMPPPKHNVTGGVSFGNTSLHVI